MSVFGAVPVCVCHLTHSGGKSQEVKRGGLEGVVEGGEGEVVNTLLYGYCPTTGWFLVQAGATQR